MSANIRNKSYVFRGIQLGKDDYEKALKAEMIGSFSRMQKLQQELRELIERKALHKYADVVASTDVTGNHILNSKNVKNSFGVYGAENIKNGIRILNDCREIEDAYGHAEAELIYDCVAVSYKTYNCAFSFLCNTGVSNARYSALCLSSSNIFGCVGLKKNEYVILNTQYTKDEYHSLVPKIIEHMKSVPYTDSRGRIYAYGEFFPLEFSPHCYNECISFDLYPISKEMALDQGYLWKEKEPKNYSISCDVQNIPDAISDAPESIVKEVIGCADKGECEHQCTNAFRILPEDVEFYRRFNLPLPRLCPNCRHYERLALREPVRIWQRTCMCDRPGHSHASHQCPNTFETSYSPERSEIIYCEECYQKEVL